MKGFSLGLHDIGGGGVFGGSQHVMRAILVVHQDGCAAKIIKILNSRNNHKKMSSAFDLLKDFFNLWNIY